MFLRETRYTKSFTDSAEFQKRYHELDKFYSNKKLGAFIIDGRTVFRIFSPSAIKIKLCLFDKPENKKVKEYLLYEDPNGIWEIALDQELPGKYYGYKIYHIGDDIFSPDMPVCVDPYAKAITTYTDYMNPRLGIIIKDDNNYDWEGTSNIKQDWRDLIIYEMHIKDITAHKSSKSKNRGSYKGLIEKKSKGGLNYIKSLGVNTVELLPVQEFGYFEIPYHETYKGKYNTWNPYERNHWGYMTSNFFAPAAYYNETTIKLKRKKYLGKSGSQIIAFKDMVKAFHKEGIAVIMDVVYNHLSEYEIGNLKQIDKDYYFRMDSKGNYISESYCGNDLKTERPMVRRLIIESILYWMNEYHIDGFRFDMGKLIDWITIEEISTEARKINPDIILICEPWGGGYDPHGFSLRGWGSWNDQIRNGIKGENPSTGLGWIFGKWYGHNSRKHIQGYINGTLIKDSHGMFERKEHSVNYLESHDGYTLGDFIRIATSKANPDIIIKNADTHAKLTPVQLKLNKLAALFLFTSQGITMIHSGQEFARSKVIPYNIKEKDAHKCKMDHNSYNKDNETNYINYKHSEINKDLLNYYKGLIELRKKFPTFRRAAYNEIHFMDHLNSKFGIGYLLKSHGEVLAVLLNADQHLTLEFKIPEGTWEVLIDKNAADVKLLYEVKDHVKLEPVTGIVLRLKTD